MMMSAHDSSQWVNYSKHIKFQKVHFAYNVELKMLVLEHVVATVSVETSCRR